MSYTEIKKLDVVASSIDPKVFFDKYVLTRTPVIIEGDLQDKEWRGSELWNNDYLHKMSGKDLVQVEVKKEIEVGFGKGSKEIMTFSDFLHVLEKSNNNDSNMYLTTQDLNYSEEGKPDLVSNPVVSLLNDFPVVPSIMGHLIPQNVNLWMGASKNETTSGLHHDYHDNLYILLRGRKRLLLFPPTKAHDLYTVGKIEKIHSNGRINYAGQLATMADGSSLTSQAALKASIHVEEAAAHLELHNKAKNNIQNDKDESEIEEQYDSEAEERLEAALEELLDAEIAELDEEEEEDDDDDDDDFNMHDDYDDDEEEDEDDDEDGQLSNILQAARSVIENGYSLKKKRKDIDEEEKDVNVNDMCVGNRQKKKNSKISLSSTTTADPTSSAAAIVESLSSLSALASSSSTTTTYPMNFSRVREKEMTEEFITNYFPLYFPAKQQSSIQVELQPNQMLYLPAGWFHEVFSIGSNNSSSSSSSNSSSSNSSSGSNNSSSSSNNSSSNRNDHNHIDDNIDDNNNTSSSSSDTSSTIHMAFNYWFHPPDGETYDQPYATDFWKQDWKERLHKLK